MKERRRGADLEEALLESAWEELSERGFAALTMEGVAARAGTSPSGARAALGEQSQTGARRDSSSDGEISDLPCPIAGSVRTELLEVLERASNAPRRSPRPSRSSAAIISGEFTKPQELIATLKSAGNPLSAILDRAVARGRSMRRNSFRRSPLFRQTCFAITPS